MMPKLFARIAKFGHIFTVVANGKLEAMQFHDAVRRLLLAKQVEVAAGYNNTNVRISKMAVRRQLLHKLHRIERHIL